MMFCLPDIGQTVHMYLCCAACTYVCGLAAPSMVGYMKERAAREGLRNFTAVQGTATSTGFEAASLDAVGVVYAFSFFDEREAMLKSIHDSLKPGGLLLVVDLPSEQVDGRMAGIDAEELIALAGAAGLTRERENGVVPGHYALIFRKKA